MEFGKSVGMIITTTAGLEPLYVPRKGTPLLVEAKQGQIPCFFTNHVTPEYWDGYQTM
jgi:hypothetical protein